MRYENLKFNNRFVEFGEKLQKECPDNDCTIFRNLFKDYCEQYAAYKKIQEAFPDLPDSTFFALRDGIRSTMKELSDMRLNNFAVLKEFYRQYPYTPLKQLSKYEIDKICDEHKEWLDDGCDDKVGKRAEFLFCDLQNIDFSNKNLRGACFYGSDLRGAVFIPNSYSLGDWDSADGCLLSNASFSHANVSGVDFTGLELEGADFSWANVNGTIFTEAFLSDAVFRDCDISGAIGLENSVMPQSQLRKLLDRAKPSVLKPLYEKQDGIARQGKDSPARDAQKKDSPSL